MKKTYTKKQITEAIKYWKGVLRKMNVNESSSDQTIINVHEYDRFNDIYLISFSVTGYQNGDTQYAITSKNNIRQVIEKYFAEYVEDDFEDVIDEIGGITSYENDKKRVITNIMKNVDNVNAFSDEHYSNHFSSVIIGPEEYMTINVIKYNRYHCPEQDNIKLDNLMYIAL